MVVVCLGAAMVSCFRPHPFLDPRVDAGMMEAEVALGDTGDLGMPDREPEGMDLAPYDADASPDLPDDHADSGLDADAESAGPPEVGPDSPDRPAEPTDGSDGGDGGDVPDSDSGNCHTKAVEPPVMVSQNGKTLVLSQLLRDKLVLWLDPSNLGPVGSPVSIWCDQSGKLNDALALSDDDPPRVTEGGGVSLAYLKLSAGLFVAHSETLNFGNGEFLVLVVSGFSHPEVGKTFFKKSNDDLTFPKQVVMDWVNYVPEGRRFTGRINETFAFANMGTAPGVERLYGLRRLGETLQVRVNGVLLNPSGTTLVTPGASTDNDGGLYLGVDNDYDNNPVDTLRAVIVVRGHLEESEVGDLEAYLISAFNLL